MADRKYCVLGIDGGGTKTHGIIADLEGKILARASGGSSNVQIAGFRDAARGVLTVAERCCRLAHCRPDLLQAVVVGLAGAGRRPDQLRTQREVRLLARQQGIRLKKLVVESDGRIALEGALGGKPGIVIIAGTGSVGFGKDAEGNIHRVGGWGRTIGDEGSGFAVGREGLRAISKHLDGRGTHTLLTALAAKAFKLSSPIDIVSKIYQNHLDVSSLAPLVLRAAGRGDRVARKILDEASTELVDHVKVLLRKLKAPKKDGWDGKVRLALLGGMLEHPNDLSQSLKKKIKSTFPEIQIIHPVESPAYGAVLMALDRARTSSRAALLSYS